LTERRKLYILVGETHRPRRRLAGVVDFLYDLKQENDIYLSMWLGKPRGEFEGPANLPVCVVVLLFSFPQSTNSASRLSLSYRDLAVCIGVSKGTLV
jgi:hypothetical protein